MRSLSQLLYSTHHFLQNGNNPTQEQFQHFLGNRTGIGSGIHSVFWVPLIDLAEVELFEQKARAMGLLGYQLMPGQYSSTPCAAWLEQATLPVYYVSPQFEASDYLGHRLDTNCNDAVAMQRSVELQQITTSHFNENGNDGVKLFIPLMSETGSLKGFVVASVLFHEFLSVTWHDEVNAESRNIEVVNLDDRAHSPVFESHINVTLNKRSRFEREVSYTKKITVPVLEQDWLISISVLEDQQTMLIYASASIVLILLLTASVSCGVGFYANRLKISDQLVKEKTRSLEFQASRDELTGLFNRPALTEEIERQLAEIKQHSSDGFSILFIDLDRFKVVNDSMGHLIGDQVLQQVACRLKTSVRKGDVCFRFGGDEFVVCLSNLVDKAALQEICEHFSQVLSKPFYFNRQACHLGASIGVSIVTSHVRSVTNILREADTAMYKAKNSGLEKVVFFDENMFTQAKQRFVLEQELTKAVKQEQLSLVFQPIYCLKTDQVSGFEALLCWNHPEYGPISPADFIPIAEETGLIVSLGDWVVRQACQILERLWQSQALAEMPRININVSAKQFESDHIINTLRDTLSQCHFPTDLLGIEITESMLLSDSSCTLNALEEIKALGAVIYLDDFGTGYSSLSMLSEYPVDIVKMDHSFIRNIDQQGHKSVQLCRAIIHMSHAISLGVVAEGVETQSQLEVLDNYGCNYIQGFLKARPVSREEMTYYLRYKSVLTSE
ncbi:EAL domain-containing protein [Photobacterium kasasachensis]|uniref:bifunctional diguanylate cyclase/phosphodiesterase n=1 Tax=Photobacterium kasasachensis TaxID=2910240 RepID=UPI003D11D8AC